MTSDKRVKLAEHCIMKKTFKSSVKQLKIIELECKVEGFTTSEIDEAFKNLRREGQIYVCRTEHYIKKT